MIRTGANCRRWSTEITFQRKKWTGWKKNKPVGKRRLPSWLFPVFLSHPHDHKCSSLGRCNNLTFPLRIRTECMLTEKSNNQPWIESHGTEFLRLSVVRETERKLTYRCVAQKPLEQRRHRTSVDRRDSIWMRQLARPLEFEDQNGSL